MPLSRTRSYRKRPPVSQHQRDVAAFDDGRQNLPQATPAESSKTRFPATALILCGLALGVLVIVGLSMAQARVRWHSAAAPVQGMATSARQVDMAAPANLAAQTVVAPTATATATPAHELIQTPAGLSSNPWAAAIPGAACIPADLPDTGKVVDVLDGDTMRVLMDRDARVYSVRYLGLRVPSLSGEALVLDKLALARHIELVFGKQAVLVRDITDTDLSGTLLRYVMVDNVFVNQAMILEGWAQVEMNPPDTACLESYLAWQKQAQREGRGIWGGAAIPSAAP